MVYAIVSEAYIHFALMYTADHIFPVITIKAMINKDGNPTRLHKLATHKNLQYHIYVCYFVHVLYGKLLHMWGKRN